MNNPLISVITPAYNAEKYIAETIESVQAQTYTNLEMIIVDDGSTDQTAEIIKDFANNDSRIQYFYQPNGKQGKARNLAIKHAKGEYLAFIDADDLWHPEKLEKQMEVFNTLPEVDLVYTCGVSFVDSKNNIIHTHSYEGGLKEKEGQYHSLLSGISLPNLSVMVKKKCVDEINGFEVDYRVQNAEDYQLWLRLADYDCQFYCLGKKLFYYRIHPDQVTHTDSSAFEQSIWATYLAPLIKVSDKNKKELLVKRVQKYLLHHIDELPEDKFKQINKLLKKPLQVHLNFLFNLLLFSLGSSFYKKYYYRFQ